MAPISFARGVPTPEALPVEELADCARAAVERDGPTVLNYGPVAGYQPLREWIAERHGVETSQVLITNGSLQGLSLLAGLLLAPGLAHPRRGADLRPHAAHRGAARGRARPAADGRRRARSRRARAARRRSCTRSRPSRTRAGRRSRSSAAERSPSSPATGSCSSSRTTRTRSSATRASACPRSTSSPRARASSTRSRSRRSSRPGSGSATSIGPAELTGRLEALAVQTYLTPSLLAAGDRVTSSSAAGGSSRTSSASSRLLRERRDAMLEAFEQELPEGTTWSRPEGGYFTWVDFPDGTDAGCASRPRDRARGHVREGQRLLPARGRRVVSSACLQLRLAGRDPDRCRRCLPARLRELRAPPVAV